MWVCYFYCFLKTVNVADWVEFENLKYVDIYHANTLSMCFSPYKSGGRKLQRSQWDIMANVLRLAKSPESKTHIMYGANLSFRQLEKYLKLLIDSGFLSVTKEKHSKATKLFVTTDDGVSFLEAYHKLEEIVRGKRRS